MGFTQPLFLVFLLLFGLGFAVVRAAARDRRWDDGYIAWSSLAFYALWYPPGIVLLLFESALIQIFSGAVQRRVRSALVLAISASLGVLAFFKYFDFFSELFLAGKWELDLLLPLGISFYTFTVIGYFVDLWRGKAEPAPNFTHALLLVAFWPHLAAGPILRARNVFVDMTSRVPLNRDTVALASAMIASGLVRKLLIADNIGAYVNWNLSYGISGMSPVEAWTVVLGFGAQIYADFAGYSDMAIGFALLLGFRLPANFNLPYRATTVREFWHRWHISLSTWFRDYLYIPLGGGRAGSLRVSVNLMIVFVLSGLWHGAAVGFVVWGAIHGGFLVLERAAGAHYLRVPAGLRWGVTMGAVFVAWGFFRLAGAEAWELTKTLFDFPRFATVDILSPYFVAPVFLLLGLLFVDHLLPAYEVGEDGYPQVTRRWLALAAVCILLPLALLFSGEQLPFIYFEF